MPAILDRLVSQLIEKGMKKDQAYAVATSQLQKAGNLDSHGKATAKGVARGAMTPAERATDRAIKYSGGKHKESDYTYDQASNRSTLKGGVGKLGGAYRRAGKRGS